MSTLARYNQATTTMTGGGMRGAERAKYNLAVNPVYQIDCTAASSGKRLSKTKRRVRWRFGFSNPEAIAQGLAGPECRGEEHEVTLVWSLTSGKRLVLADGHEVHFSTGKRTEGKFQCSWTMRGNHVLKIIAHAAPPISARPGWKQFDLLLDGMSFFDMPKIYELGKTGRSAAVVPYGEGEYGGPYGGGGGMESPYRGSGAPRPYGNYTLPTEEEMRWANMVREHEERHRFEDYGAPEDQYEKEESAVPPSSPTPAKEEEPKRDEGVPRSVSMPSDLVSDPTPINEEQDLMSSPPTWMDQMHTSLPALTASGSLSYDEFAPAPVPPPAPPTFESISGEILKSYNGSSAATPKNQTQPYEQSQALVVVSPQDSGAAAGYAGASYSDPVSPPSFARRHSDPPRPPQSQQQQQQNYYGGYEQQPPPHRYEQQQYQQPQQTYYEEPPMQPYYGYGYEQPPPQPQKQQNVPPNVNANVVSPSGSSTVTFQSSPHGAFYESPAVAPQPEPEEPEEAEQALVPHKKQPVPSMYETPDLDEEDEDDDKNLDELSKKIKNLVNLEDINSRPVPKEEKKKAKKLTMNPFDEPEVVESEVLRDKKGRLLRSRGLPPVAPTWSLGPQPSLGEIQEVAKPRKQRGPTREVMKPHAFDPRAAQAGMLVVYGAPAPPPPPDAYYGGGQQYPPQQQPQQGYPPQQQQQYPPQQQYYYAPPPLQQVAGFGAGARLANGGYAPNPKVPGAPQQSSMAPPGGRPALPQYGAPPAPGPQQYQPAAQVYAS